MRKTGPNQFDYCLLSGCAPTPIHTHINKTSARAEGETLFILFGEHLVQLRPSNSVKRRSGFNCHGNIPCLFRFIPRALAAFYLHSECNTHTYTGISTHRVHERWLPHLCRLSRARFFRRVYFYPLAMLLAWSDGNTRIACMRVFFEKLPGFFFVRRHAACTRFWTEDKLMRVLLLYICIRDTSSCVLLLVRRVVL